MKKSKKGIFINFFPTNGGHIFFLRISLIIKKTCINDNTEKNEHEETGNVISSYTHKGTAIDEHLTFSLTAVSLCCPITSSALSVEIKR